jgi:hypothetical protein
MYLLQLFGTIVLALPGLVLLARARTTTHARIPDSPNSPEFE